MPNFKSKQLSKWSHKQAFVKFILRIRCSLAILVIRAFRSSAKTPAVLAEPRTRTEHHKRQPASKPQQRTTATYTRILPMTILWILNAAPRALNFEHRARAFKMLLWLYDSPENEEFRIGVLLRTGSVWVGRVCCEKHEIWENQK